MVRSPNDDNRKTMEQIAMYIVPAITLITAIILIVAGGKLLKPAIGLSGGLLGAGAGLMVAPSLSIGVPPLIIALVFGIIAAIISIFIAKFAILFLLSVTCACALPVATWHLAGLGDGSKVIEKVVDVATDPETSPSNASFSNSNAAAVTQDAMTNAFAIFAEDAAKALRSGYRRSIAAWNAIPTGPRFMLVGASVAGLLLGLLIATFMPFLAAAIVTSVGGSILIVEAIRNFITLLWSQQSMASISPNVLLLSFVCISIAGIGLQLTLAKRTVKVTKKTDD
jgi:hypothetical protein